MSRQNETNDLAENFPDKVVELEAALTQWGKDRVDPVLPPRPSTTYNLCGTPFEFPI
jgi:hypothetical protein